jgi:multidrug resistance efflux pump
MMWILGGVYCLVIWLVFDKWRLLRLSLPIAVVLAAVGPAVILTLLFCAQYCHPYSSGAVVLAKTVPIAPQLSTRVRVTNVVATANSPLEPGDVLFEVDRAPLRAAADLAIAAQEEAKANVEVAEAAVVTAQATRKRAEADLKFATRKREREAELVQSRAVSEEAYEQTLTQYQQAASAAEQSQAALSQATLGVQLAKTRLSKAEIAARDAQYDLEQATVVAPAAGYVTNLQLRPGTLVGGLGSQPVMTFVETSHDAEQVVVAAFPQKNLLLIEPGQYAEVIFDAHPGRVFAGEVLNVIEVTGGGQLLASGDLPEVLPGNPNSQFVARIRLDASDSLRLPGGATGQAAVYTDNVPVAGIPVMFVLRAQSWLNYVW